MNLLRRMFPEIRQTRFRNSAEFYSLFMLVWDLNHNGFVMNDRRRNKVAFALLEKLSTGVDSLREQLRKGTIQKGILPVYRDYLLTVQGDTDSAATRERRRGILNGLLGSLFERKDESAFSVQNSDGSSGIQMTSIVASSAENCSSGMTSLSIICWRT